MTLVAETQSPPDRGYRYFIAHQNPWSWATLVLGTVTLALILVGTPLVLNAFGWTQECPEGATIAECSTTAPLTAGLTSNGLGLVITLTWVLAVATAAVASFSWRRYDTKPNKEATVAGFVLATQGAALAGVLYWFRGSEVERFARNFLDIALLGEKAGFLLSSITTDLWSVVAASFDTGVIFAALGLGAWLMFVAGMWAIRHTPPGMFVRIAVGLAAAGALAGTLLGLGADSVIVSALFALAGAIAGMVLGVLAVVVWALAQRKLGFPGFRWKLLLALFGAGLAFGMFEEITSRAVLPSFARGAWNTLVLSLAGAALGFGLGLVISLFTMSKRPVVRAPARLYINFFRGTPLIWQISFAGIGLVPALRLDLSMYTIAILVLGFNLAAYSSEVYRSGIQSIERGQIEASRSLGLTYFQSMGYVIVPQAIRRVIPPLLNEFVILIKDTSLVSVLGLTIAQKELLGVGRDIYSSSFDATAWLGAAAGFLIITLPMIRIVTIVERRMRSGLTSAIG